MAAWQQRPRVRGVYTIHDALPTWSSMMVIDDQKPRHSLSMTIRMAVPPIPILILLPVIQRRVFPVFLVLFSKIYAVGTVLVAIPIVVVLVRAIVNACLFFSVLVVVLRRRARSNCYGCGQCGSQEKKTYVSVSGFHFVLLLSLRNPIPVFSAGVSMRVASRRRCTIEDTSAELQNSPVFRF